MKFDWGSEKDELLKETRNISFKEIVYYIENGFVMKDDEHPNKEKYPNQRIYYININDYILRSSICYKQRKQFYIFKNNYSN